jgi:sensor domain CHASE-containing protein
MLRRVALVGTDVSEERIASIIRVKRMNDLEKLVTVNVLPTSLIIFILMIEAIRSSESSVLTRATRRHIKEDSIIRLSFLPNINSNVLEARINFPHYESRN